MLREILRKVKGTLQLGIINLNQPYFWFAKNKVECNVCGYKANQLQSDGWHLYSICPRCKSSFRQRLLWASLTLLDDVNLNNLIKGKRVLHFAPDTGITDNLRKAAGCYETADYLAEGYSYSKIDHNLDISDLKSIDDNQYDCVIACDVLEHVPNHLKALTETNRILKQGGYCIFTIPQKDHAEKTEEDLSNMSAEEREKRFGQWDHWRIYGTDFAGMLANAGFDVTVTDASNFSDEVVKKYVLFPPVLSKHPMATNYRHIYFGRKR